MVAVAAESSRDALEDLLGPAPGVEEVSCDRCFELIDAFVDAELAGEDAATSFPGMEEHLSGCPACREDRESLRALAAPSPPDRR